MKTLNQFITEAKSSFSKKKWPGGKISGETWKQISKEEHDDLFQKHSENLGGNPNLYVHEFENGDIGRSHYHHYNSPRKQIHKAPTIFSIKHTDGSMSYWKKRDKPLSESYDEDYDEKWNTKVGDTHLAFIKKKYGKKADIDFGKVHNEISDRHHVFSSKVHHPDHGTVYVNTHYDPKTLKVIKHEEE